MAKRVRAHARRVVGTQIDTGEHEHAVALKDAIDLHTAAHPELDLLYAIPNGGERHILVAKKLKAEGAKPGIPDYHLPVARGGFFSLYVELKTLTGSASREQIKVARKLEAAGHRVVICRGWELALAEILAYLSLPPTLIAHQR